jgi:hypothetical protein
MDQDNFRQYFMLQCKYKNPKDHNQDLFKFKEKFYCLFFSIYLIEIKNLLLKI